MLKNRKFIATFTGLFLLTAMVGVVVFKAPEAMGVYSLPVYMVLVVLLVLGYLKFNVAQKKFWKGIIEMKKGGDNEL